MASAPAPIRFFMPDAPYGWLCALSAHPVEIDGRLWPTAEHFYQAQKFPFHHVVQELIRAEPDPFRAKAISKEHKALVVGDWKPTRCLEVFRYATHAKFRQHPSLAAQLLATGDAELIEESPDDAFWGSGPSGDGQNWVGRIVMEVRAALTKA